ncbi:MAG: helix-turn-helix transcriptional regulator [Clostridia bacterium]|nr:helix-turn-helix transcriptional regulator [Clostridia bacterium]
MTVGEKLKKARKEQGLTQAALSQGIVTRNMLSEIENGVAAPSIATIKALAARLELPIEYFFSEEDDLFFFQKKNLLPHLKQAMARGNYRECIRLFKQSDLSTDDELAYMLAECHYKEAEKALHNGSLRSAAAHLSLLKEYTEQTIYSTAHFSAGATVLSAIVTNVQSPRYEFDQKEYVKHTKTAILSELCAYLLEDVGYPYTSVQYAKHLEARKLMKENRYAAALSLLTELEAQKSTYVVSAFFLFRLYADLESTYRELGDYENAYKYSSKRLAQLAAFRT